MRVALDAMGGDFAPEMTIAGALEAVAEYDLEVILVGDRHRLTDALKDKRYPTSRISVVHASEVVAMHEAPSTALRKKKDSSIRRAIELVNVATGEVTRPVSPLPPFDAFYYVPWPGRGSYVFPLVTWGLQPGQYQLRFRAGVDPTVHGAPLWLR